MKIVIAGISLLVVLFAITNVIGGAMWNLTDHMDRWWWEDDK